MQRVTLLRERAQLEVRRDQTESGFSCTIGRRLTGSRVYERRIEPRLTALIKARLRLIDISRAAGA